MAVISDFQQVMLKGQIKHDISGSATIIGLNCPNSAKYINIIVSFIKLLALFRVKWIKTQSGRTDEFLHSFNFLEICYIDTF